MLNSSTEWIFCTNMVFNEGSFGTKLRGNLLVTEAINPEEIQWWSYLRRYWLRCWGRPALLHVMGRKGEEEPGRESSDHQLWQEVLLFQCVPMYACVCMCVYKWVAGFTEGVIDFFKTAQSGRSGSAGAWSGKGHHCSKCLAQTECDGDGYCHWNKTILKHKEIIAAVLGKYTYWPSS